MGCGASAESQIQNADAPHMTQYFQMLEDHSKKEQEEAQKAMKGGDIQAIMAAAMDPAKQKEAQEKKERATKQLHVKLTPIIEKAFDYHDKNKNEKLDPDESKAFFDNYVKLQSQFINVLAAHNKEMATQMALKMMGNMKNKEMQKALKGKAQEELKEAEKMVQECVDEYKGNEEECNKAAFAVIDTDKDKQLVKKECVKALLLDTPENIAFVNAFPTGPENMMKKQMAKAQAAMAELQASMGDDPECQQQ
jgi:hypothetical protein